MLKRNFAATTEQIGSPRILIDQPHFLKPVDWASVIDEYQSDIEEKEKKDKLNALANALQTGDEEAINSALAAQNPTGYAERLHQMKLAKEKRAQELADKEMQHQRSLALESHRSDLGARRDEAAHERTLALEQLKRDWYLEDKAREREQLLEDKEAERQDFYAQESYKKELEAQNKELPLLVKEQSKYPVGSPMYELYGRAIENATTKLTGKTSAAKLPNAIYYANELEKLDPNNPDHQPRIKILNGLLAKEMTVANSKSNIAKEIQLLNRRAELDPNNPVDAKEIALIDGILLNQKQGTPAKEIQLLNELEKTNPEMTKEEKAELIKSAIGGKQQQPKDTRTTEEKRYDFAKAQNYSEEDAVAYAMKTGKFAPNQGKPAKTPEQLAIEEAAKTEGREKAKKDLAKKTAMENIEKKIRQFEEKADDVSSATESGVGLGELEYRASSIGRPLLGWAFPKYFEEASQNQQNVKDLNIRMRDLVREAMATQNISSRQADTQWEQEKMFYDISPDMDETQIETRVNNFREYMREILNGNPYYTRREKKQKTPNKILSITEEK